MGNPYRCLTKMITVVAGLICAVPGSAWAAAMASLQPLIDAAKPGDVITPDPGLYAGPLLIDKAITLDGAGQVTIDSGGVGSVIVLQADGATIRGLHLRNTGESHNDLDAGIQVRGSYNVIKDNVITDNLFGIDIQKSDNNIVTRNRIGSKKFDLGVRGDGIRLWYSNKNRIEDNTITDARDMVVWYSRDNVIASNAISGGRYGLHFMYAQYNLVKDNRFQGNSVGTFLMYSDGVEMRGNRISHGLGATGMGIGMKESSDVTLEDNTIVYCATGIYMDVSPYQPDTTNRIRRNYLAFNSIGILFHNDWTGNVLEDNRFESNFVQVSVNAGASAQRNAWDGNYWDDYQGFDRNRDGIGDSVHEMRVYADRLWMDVPAASFFKGSAVLSMLDFLERLAPFSEPIVLLKDPRPKMTPDVKVARAAEIKGENNDPDSESKIKYDPFGLSTRVPKYMNQ
ncbi:nitrous oxide reductase family maturation protein NosD [Magnetovibrio sp.]|uniref:nitrous oxide reductase family maturation protein NosD n=1 Tax=Magnetovibrio sp. TaxID=2024836 RepID=UPI002F92B1CF